MGPSLLLGYFVIHVSSIICCCETELIPSHNISPWSLCSSLSGPSNRHFQYIIISMKSNAPYGFKINTFAVNGSCIITYLSSVFVQSIWSIGHFSLHISTLWTPDQSLRHMHVIHESWDTVCNSTFPFRWWRDIDSSNTVFSTTSYTRKTKSVDGDIPYFIRFVSVS